MNVICFTLLVFSSNVFKGSSTLGFMPTVLLKLNIQPTFAMFDVWGFYKVHPAEDALNDMKITA